MMEDAMLSAIVVLAAATAGWLMHGAVWNLRELWLMSCAAEGEPVMLGGQPYLLVRQSCSSEPDGDPLAEEPPAPRPRKRFRAEGW